MNWTIPTPLLLFAGAVALWPLAAVVRRPTSAPRLVVEAFGVTLADALIVDIVIGQSAGWELLEQLHVGAATTGIPVLVLSTDPRLLRQAQELSERYATHRNLDKPFALDALLAHIREMIGEA